MKIVLLAAIFGSSLVYSQTECKSEKKLTNLRGESSFCYVEDGFLVSKNCLSDPKCNWQSVRKEVSLIKLNEEDVSGGKNPASKKCDKAGYEVEIFRDENLDEETFCEIFNNRFISTTSFQ
jgi:putative hemolysin